MESKHHNIMYFPYQTARTVLRNYSILVSYNFSVIVQRESAWLATPSGVERTWLATPSLTETETVDGLDMMRIDLSTPFITILGNSERASGSERGLPHLLGWRDVACHTFTHGYIGKTEKKEKPEKPKKLEKLETREKREKLEKRKNEKN